MRYLLSFSITAIVMFTGYSRTEGPVELRNFMDSLSYSLGVCGVDIYEEWLDDDRAGIDVRIVGRGETDTEKIIDERLGAGLVWYYVNSISGDTFYGRRNRGKYVAEYALLMRSYMLPGVDSLPGGLLRRIIETGEGPFPDENDYVVMSIIPYSAEDLEAEREVLYEDPVKLGDKFHQGFRRAVTTMREGERSMLYIPWNYSYDDIDRLRYRVELRPVVADVELKMVIKTSSRKAGDYRMTDPPCANPEAGARKDRNPYFFRDRVYDFRYEQLTVIDPGGDTVQVVRNPDLSYDGWENMVQIRPWFFLPDATAETERTPVIAIAEVFNPQGFQHGCFVYAMSGQGVWSYAGRITEFVGDPTTGYSIYHNYDLYSLKQALVFEDTAAGLVITLEADRLYDSSMESNPQETSSVRYIYRDGRLVRCPE